MITKANEFDLNIRWQFPDGRKYVFALIALFVFLIIIYANSFQGTFQFDDKVNIVENKNIVLESLNWPDIKNTFYGIEGKRIDRPLAYLSFALNYYFHKLDVLGYHVVNFVIHYLAAVFLFIFIHRTLNLPMIRGRYESISYSIALLATVFWATSPVQVTAVTYIVQRMAGMAGLFYIMAMYFYLKGRTSDKSWKCVIFWCFCVLFAILSFATKENAVLIPLSIWIYDLLLIQGVTRQSLVRNLKIFVPLILIMVVIGLWHINIASILNGAAYSNRPFTLWERLLTEPRVIIFYITLLLYPISSRLTLIHDIELSTSLLSPWSTIPAIALILAFIVIAVCISRKRPLIAFCILFFFLNHTIEGTFIPLELIYEHRNYVPAMFFFVPPVILMLHVIDYFSYRKMFQLIIVAVLTFLLFAQGHTVYLRNTLFTHPLLLWADNVEKSPNLSRTHNNLGVAYWDLGFTDDAYKHYTTALSLNRQTNLKNHAVNLYNIGMYHSAITHDFDKALDHFESAIKIYPVYWPAYNDTALCYLQKGNLAEAGKQLVKALSIWPNNATLRYSLGLVLLKSGKYQAAAHEARRALTLNPELHKARCILGEVAREQGNYSLATHYWTEYLTHYPKDVEANLALIELYAHQNKQEKLPCVIGRLMFMKGEKTWLEFIDQILKAQEPSAYIPIPEKLITIIKESFAHDLK